MTWQRPSNEKCPECGGMLLEKGNKLVCEHNECGYIKQKEKNNENQYILLCPERKYAIIVVCFGNIVWGRKK